MQRPKKSLGQHFLVNKKVAEKIVALTGVSNDPMNKTPSKPETFVEVGPGHGILTKPLANQVKRVLALEIDATLIPPLKTRLSTCNNLQIVHANGLTFDYSKIPGKICIVSNLPYYLSTPLLFRFLALRTKVTQLILMFQKELAERITATPNTKAYGQLSVVTQIFADTKIAFTVPASCFIPPPKVDSSVVSFQIRLQPKSSINSEAHFIDIVKKSFAYRRKTLLGALCQSGLKKIDVISALEIAQIVPRRRAETLSIEEFAALSNAFTPCTKTTEKKL